jgi:hypothetical protein
MATIGSYLSTMEMPHCLVFGSPRRLNLRLGCTPKTHTKNGLDIWPALPLVVEGDMAKKKNQARTTSSQHLGTVIAYVKSSS